MTQLTVIDHPLPDSTVHFDAFLHPHRSLSINGFYVLMGALILISLIVGT